MHVFIQILIIYGLLLCIGALSIAWLIRVAEVYPCENCGRNPATRELLAGRQLCESCFLACEKNPQPPIGPDSQNPGQPRTGLHIVNGPSIPLSRSSVDSQPGLSNADAGDPKFVQALK